MLEAVPTRRPLAAGEDQAIAGDPSHALVGGGPSRVTGGAQTPEPESHPRDSERSSALKKKSAL